MNVRKKKLLRVEEVLKGHFGVQPRLLAIGKNGIGKVYDFPYNEKKVEFKVKFEKWYNDFLIINSSEGSKLVFKSFSLLKIFDIETQKLIDTKLKINTFNFSYNPKRNHILVFNHDFNERKNVLTAYNFSSATAEGAKGKKVISKEFDFIGALHVFDNYLVLVNNKSLLLIDLFNYELIRSIEFPSFDDYKILGSNPLQFIYPSPWISKNRLLIHYHPSTLVYDISEEKVIEVIKRPVSRVINSDYGIAQNLNEKTVCYYNSIIKLDNPYENIMIPKSNYYWGEGYNSDEILLTLNKRVFTFNLKTKVENTVLNSKTGVAFSFYLPGRKVDKKILYQVLKKRLVDYLPLDLIKLTFEQMIN